MKDNERLVEALKQSIENKPDIELGKFIRYITSISNLAYMTDEDISILVEEVNLRACKEKERSGKIDMRRYEFKATDNHYLEAFSTSYPEKVYKMYEFTKENEQIAYDRYRDETVNKIFCPLEERLNGSEFLKRFDLIYVNADDFKDVTVINHRDNFLNTFPAEYRHMNAYVVGRKGNKCIARHAYVEKNPCFGELLKVVSFDFCKEFDECFSIAIDWMESPRFTDYTKHIMYGVCTRPKKKQIEIYDDNQTIEIFHELMQRSNMIVSDWDGVIYDDGTLSL